MKKYVFGVDIGGTTVKMGLFEVDGTLLEKWEIKTRTEDHGINILPDIAGSIQKKLQEKKIAKEEVAGAGVGVPGPVDVSGTVHKAVNLGWDIMNINEELGRLLGMKVAAGNDANVAALGEMWKGGAQGHKDVVMVTLGTGVGGGIIVDGKIVCGATGAGGEIGHIHVRDDEEDACGCGNHGCLEQYASATGIVRLMTRKLESTDAPCCLRGKELNGKIFWDAVEAGDELAKEVSEEFGSYLGKGLAVIASIVNPEIFIIGGGVSKSGPVVMENVLKNYTPNVFHGSRNVEFALASLGNDGGIYGAAKLVIDQD